MNTATSPYLNKPLRTELETRVDAASTVLYLWACDTITTEQAKQDTRTLGFEIDFRQADVSNTMIAHDTFNSYRLVELEF